MSETQKRKALTSDILGGIKREKPVPTKWRSEFNQLSRMREELSERKKDLVKDATEEKPSFGMHIGDAGTDTYDQDFALSMISSEQSALFEIEAAMARIKDGSYGVCEITGKPIEPERLEAIPWTRYSLEGVQQLEAQGQFGRTRLADRGSWNEPSASDEAEAEEKEEEAG